MSTPEDKAKEWLEEAEKEWDIAKYLFEGRRYSACLFFCHLSIEKLLKGLIIKRSTSIPPYSHELKYLAKYAKMSLDEEQEDNLDEISDFNISGRYTQDKKKFYKKINRQYATKYFYITQDYYKWLREMYRKQL